MLFLKIYASIIKRLLSALKHKQLTTSFIESQYAQFFANP